MDYDLKTMWCLIAFENDKTYDFKHSVRLCEQALRTRPTERVPAWTATTHSWGFGVKIRLHYLNTQN